MPYPITIEVMLDSRPALNDQRKERMRWKLGDIVAVYERKPNVRPGMPRTVYIHIDDVPDRINIARIRWTLLHDRGTLVDANGDLIFRERCRWRISRTKVTNTFWNALRRDRSATVLWRQFRRRIGHRISDVTMVEGDFTTGPTA